MNKGMWRHLLLRKNEKIRSKTDFTILKDTYFFPKINLKKCSYDIFPLRQ